jgi:hypothetical protein
MQKSLIEKYIADAMLHGECSHNGNWRLGNKAMDRLMAAIPKFRAMPDRGESALTALLDHPSEWVRLCAATDLLPLREDLARGVLEKLLKASSRHAAFDAKMVLSEWDKGRLRGP